MFHSIEEAVSELKSGKPIILASREKNAGDLLLLSEQAVPEAIQFMADNGKGLIRIAITAAIGRKLGLFHHGIKLSVALDHKDAVEGISAKDRADTIHKMIQPETGELDFKQPGHVLPVIAAERGVLQDQGFAEAAVDLAILSGAIPSGVICEILNDTGSLQSLDELAGFAAAHSLKLVSVEDLAEYRKGNENHVKREVETVLPSAFGDFRVVGYSNDLDDKEHIAIVKGDVASGEPVLARIHSECFTGDIFGSHRCDCGPQLHAALAKIEQTKRGVIIYMRQEGRGIGLINKLRAYKLQDEGRDTHQANVELGFKPDAREYHLAAQILQDLGIRQVDLMTNNPDKITALEACGVPVHDRVPLQVEFHKENEHYMETKMKKFGHMLDLHS